MKKQKKAKKPSYQELEKRFQDYRGDLNSLCVKYNNLLENYNKVSTEKITFEQAYWKKSVALDVANTRLDKAHKFIQLIVKGATE